ncbi:MAG: biotin/lipoyl-binding protein, partial [Lapillicoccus sp.]
MADRPASPSPPRRGPAAVPGDPRLRRVGLRHAWLRRALAGVAVAVLAGGAYAVHAATAATSDASRYRTSTVTAGAVDQRLPFTGTVTRLSQVTATFSVSGRVATLAVGLGDPVTAGQVLATLDPAALQQAVLDAKATLAQAQAQLASDSTPSTTSSSATGTSSSGSTSSARPSTGSGSTTTTGSGGSTSGLDLSALTALDTAVAKDIAALAVCTTT